MPISESNPDSAVIDSVYKSDYLLSLLLENDLCVCLPLTQAYANTKKITHVIFLLLEYTLISTSREKCSFGAASCSLL